MSEIKVIVVLIVFGALETMPNLYNLQTKTYLKWQHRTKTIIYQLNIIMNDA